MNETDETFMRRAIALSAQAAATPGAQPFGAVVVKDGQVVGEGFNQAIGKLDPTSHGETEAMRDACNRLGTLDLSGCTVFTSCEPCALCVAAMQIAKVDAVVYAAAMADSARVLGGVGPDRRVRVDATALRLETSAPIGTHRMKARRALVAEAVGVLEGWAARP
ncbi:nucleoside deaminase [Falsiroseomonas tokyonensis]|uniref:Nucleoside deaminase n=1 Tax=Falsiroseomonas tokyonensis TaxID=430521 RepID=A0ABV7BYH3_9PROT|nr:nucleoside deaminase [Falsiroseomonas tokyonensis]MBU8539103.1 nucleoside deaminase [Falsiroseomonas tokyonensis]